MQWGSRLLLPTKYTSLGTNPPGTCCAHDDGVVGRSERGQTIHAPCMETAILEEGGGSIFSLAHGAWSARGLQNSGIYRNSDLREKMIKVVISV